MTFTAFFQKNMRLQIVGSCKYLKGDQEILKHIGPDGDDTAGVLFVRFVEENLRKTGVIAKRCWDSSNPT